MEPPAITRHRRPFLAPVWLSMLAVVVMLVVLFLVYRSADTTVVVLVCPVDKDIATIDDPPLSPEGEQRAQRLAQMFGQNSGSGRLDDLYVSDSRSAQQTAATLSDRLGRKPVVVPGKDTAAMASRVMHEHEGGTAMVIGSSNTIPQLVHEFTGLSLPANVEGDPDVLYVVSIPTFGRPNLLRVRY